MTRPVIEIERLVKRYHERTVIQGLSLSIMEGEIFGLLGPNGAGKSTTISILAGLIMPDEGTVIISGFDSSRHVDSIRPLIGFVPQELALYPTLSAKDNLLFFGQIYGLRRDLLKERVAWALDLVRLGDRANDPVKTFSGGMQRRLNIAVGLIDKPNILFLDEPTVGVDPQSRNFIFEHVEHLKAGGMTILYTTHYMEEAERLCDRVAIVDEGKVLALDTPRGPHRSSGRRHHPRGSPARFDSIAPARGPVLAPGCKDNLGSGRSPYYGNKRFSHGLGYLCRVVQQSRYCHSFPGGTKDKPGRCIFAPHGQASAGIGGMVVQQIFAMTWKELKVFFKDPGAVMLILLQPLMFILIMSYAMSGLFRSGDSPIRILVVNEDPGKEAMTVIKDLGAIQGFQAETTWEGKSLDRQTAERLIIKGKRNLALVFPSDFSSVL